MKKVRILVYEGSRNDVERNIQYRNIKGVTKLSNSVVMDEHIVPDTHVVVEMDRADHTLLDDLVRGLHAGTKEMISDADLKMFERIRNGVYGGDVRV